MLRSRLERFVRANSSLRGKCEFASRSSGNTRVYRAKIVWCTRRVENTWLQKKEKFFSFDTSASGGFSQSPCGRPAVYSSGVKSRAGSRYFNQCYLAWWKKEVLPTSATKISGWCCWRTAGRLFQGKREQFEGENSERPVVFWRPSREKVRG